MEDFVSTLVALFALMLSVSTIVVAASYLCSRVMQAAGNRRALRETLNRKLAKKADRPVRN